MNEHFYYYSYVTKISLDYRNIKENNILRSGVFKFMTGLRIGNF